LTVDSVGSGHPDTNIMGHTLEGRYKGA
jgi:hypothetical protein